MSRLGIPVEGRPLIELSEAALMPIQRLVVAQIDNPHVRERLLRAVLDYGRACTEEGENRTMAATGDLMTRVGRALYGQEFKTELAAKLEVRHDTVRQWCNGRMSPPSAVWGELKRALLARQINVAVLLDELDERAAIEETHERR